MFRYPSRVPGEVLVKVAFCGICHSDLSLINGTFPAQLAVVTQGHEASGTIAKLGPGSRVGRGRPGGRGRGQAVPGMRELPPRRHVQLPADPADGVRLRRRVGGVHRRAGVRADPGSRQRAAGAGRDPGRRGVHAVRRRGAHGQGGHRRVGRRVGRRRRRHAHGAAGPAGRRRADHRGRHQTRRPRPRTRRRRRLRVRRPRRRAARQDRRSHRRPRARRRIRRGRPEVDIRAGARQPHASAASWSASA